MYGAILGHDLVFGYDTEGLSQAIATFQGKQASLAQPATFTHLVSSEAKEHALTLFVSLENLAKAPGMVGDAYRQLLKQNGSSMLSRVTATYVTYSLDSGGIIFTEDVALK